MSNKLTVEQAEAITGRIIKRAATNGDLEMTLMVVLMNCGDQFTQVKCVGGEWTGTKGDLPPGSGLPKCPNGHVLLEFGPRKVLGWVDEELV